MRCRQLFGNRLEGRIPTSLLAMRIPALLYAPPLGSALNPATPRASCRRCSLFPQEGCPLARYGRESQDKDANDFGVCVAGPVRPLVAMQLGPSLQPVHKTPTPKPTLAHRRETDSEIRITVTHPSTVSPATSATTSGRHGPIFGWLVVLYSSGTIVTILIKYCLKKQDCLACTGTTTVRVFLSQWRSWAWIKIHRHFPDCTRKYGVSYQLYWLLSQHAHAYL